MPQKRHHPSLVLWCGGNELASAEGPLDESAPVLGALRDVVRELDPGRGWLPTSPSGPSSLNRLDLIAADPEGQHDVHGPGSTAASSATTSSTTRARRSCTASSASRA